MKAVFENSNFNFYIEKAHRFPEYPPTFHKHMELVYVKDGHMKISIGDKSRVLGKGETAIIFPYEIHSYEATDDVCVVFALFSPSVAETYFKILTEFKPKNPFLADIPEILSLMEKALAHYRTNYTLSTVYLTTAIGEILPYLSLVKVGDKDLNTIQQILAYCNEHYKENLGIKDVANALFISESCVTKVFSVKLGYSFRKFINSLRIAKAKKLIKNSDLSITDIMYECGYNNQSSFNRIFLAETGTTPRKYRESAQE